MVENPSVENEVKSCFRKRMSYVETREYLLDLGKYENVTVIKVLQREYVKHKTKASKSGMFGGFVLLLVFPLVDWMFNHQEPDYEFYYKPMIFGVVIFASSFVSFQRAKAAARRYEEFG